MYLVTDSLSSRSPCLPKKQQLLNRPNILKNCQGPLRALVSNQFWVAIQLDEHALGDASGDHKALVASGPPEFLLPIGAK